MPGGRPAHRSADCGCGRLTPPVATEAWEGTPPPAEFLERGAPAIATEEVPDCPVCGNPDFAQHAVGFDYELLTCRNPWRFVGCRKCSHVWLNPRPAVTELATIYPPTYYAYHYDQINPIALRGKALMDARKFAGILKELPRRPESYLDAGCADGRFLRLMERKGVPRHRAYGLELDERVVERLVAEGFPVFCERVEECRRIEAESIDLATMFHVIEHVDRPAAVVERLAAWLSAGGVLALETPNLDSLDHRLFAATWWGGYHFPRHWHLFSPHTLRRLLEDAGLEVLDTRFQTGHTFWAYSVHHRLRHGRHRRPRLARRFDPFQGLAPVLAFTAIDKLRATLGRRTSAMLMLARKPA